MIVVKNQHLISCFSIFKAPTLLQDSPGNKNQLCHKAPSTSKNRKYLKFGQANASIVITGPPALGQEGSTPPRLQARRVKLVIWSHHPRVGLEGSPT